MALESSKLLSQEKKTSTVRLKKLVIFDNVLCQRISDLTVEGSMRKCRKRFEVIVYS